MRALFCFHLVGQSRHFLTVIRAMLNRGDEVFVLAAKAEPGMEPPPYLADLPGLQFVSWPDQVDSFWALHADAFRMARNAAFFSNETFRRATEIRGRLVRVVDPVLRPLASGTRLGNRLLSAIETAIPPPASVIQIFRAIKPDIVLISPLVNHLTGVQTDFVKAAEALGIPTALPAFSWDNFSSKGAIHAIPDRIFVWNRCQVDELQQLHGVDPSRISAHGAWRFDDYRHLEPTVERSEFYASHGFNSSSKTILYLGSSPLIAPQEGRFFVKWLKAVRNAADPAVAEANVLVRAHPRNVDAWIDHLAEGMPERVTFQDPEILNLFDQQALHNTIAHVDACIAVNTSAVLEAALQCKPVLTVRSQDTAAGQAETLHYRYLTQVGGGLLYEAPNLTAHLDDLALCLSRPQDAQDARAISFTRAFLDHPDGVSDCTASLLTAIDSTAALSKVPVRPNPLQGALELCLRWLVSSGLLPITPIVNPQANCNPGRIGGRSVPASLRHPSTLPVFRGLWARRFAPIQASLAEVLADKRPPSAFDAVLVEELQPIAAFSHQSLAMRVLAKRCRRLLASRRKETRTEITEAREKLAQTLSWCSKPGGCKFLLERMVPELDEDAARLRASAAEGPERETTTAATRTSGTVRS